MAENGESTKYEDDSLLIQLVGLCGRIFFGYISVWRHLHLRRLTLERSSSSFVYGLAVFLIAAAAAPLLVGRLLRGANIEAS